MSVGKKEMMACMKPRISEGMETADYAIPPADGARLAWLYQHGEVVERRDSDAAVQVKVRLLPADRVGAMRFFVTVPSTPSM